MANTINYRVSGTAGSIIRTSDGSANLDIQVNDVTVLTIDQNQNIIFNNSGVFSFPSGNTAQRPSNPVVGMVRYNTDFRALEGYSATGWGGVDKSINFLADILIVAGGGGGGSGATSANNGGGGGAGGYLYIGNEPLQTGTAYTVTVGAGGAADTNGANSSFGSLYTSIGGGSGGGKSPAVAAKSGGSGGGGCPAVPLTGGSGTTGQGNAGGNGNPASPYQGGGGGGAGLYGGSPNGNGGIGLSNRISGTDTYYAGGGGGGADTSAGTGGSGVGGNGGLPNSTLPTAGATNRGGGGGGGASQGSAIPGAAGGSGIVIVRYAGAQRATGGTVTTVGAYTVHTFTSSGTFTI